MEDTKVLYIDSFSGGISEDEKRGPAGSFRALRKLNIHLDPNRVTAMPKTAKESSTVVTGLPKWIVSGRPHNTNTYAYDENGVIYRRVVPGTWMLDRSVAASVGQGLGVAGGFLYYTRNTAIGRLDLAAGTYDDSWQTGLQDTSTTKFAPIKAFGAGVVVGHANYVGWWDGSVWDPDRLVLPTGLHVRSIERIDEYVVIGTWRGTAISDSEEGYLFWWDGTSTSWNFVTPHNDGGFNALLNYNNRLLSVAGDQGQIYEGAQQLAKKQQIPKIGFDKYLEIYPGAVTNWKGFALFGFGGSTDSTEVRQGVYQWGSRSERYPEVLNFAWEISTGTSTGTGVKIGAVYGEGDRLYIGWKDGSTYGIDTVTNSSAPYTQASLETLIFDGGRLFDDKRANIFKVTHLALAANETVQLGYKVDRAASFTEPADGLNSTDDSTETRLPLPASATRFNEIELSVVINGTTTSPTITSLALAYEPNLDEERV